MRLITPQFILNSVMGVSVGAVVAMTAQAQENMNFPPDYLPEDLIFSAIEEDQRTAPAASVTAPTMVQQMPAQQPVAPMPGNNMISVPVSALPTTSAQTPQSVASMAASTSVPMPAYNAGSVSFTMPSEAYVPGDVAASEELTASRSLTELAGYGVFTQDKQGFAPTLWHGLNREEAEQLLTRLVKKPLTSEEGRTLLRRLLLTQATPPVTKAEDASSWLGLRANVLMQMNEAEAAFALLNVAQPEHLAADALLAKRWSEAMLMAGNHPRACGYIRNQVLNNDAAFWRQAVTVCQLLEGEFEPLRLSLNLLTEEDRRQDWVLFQLLGAVVNDDDSPRLAPNAKLSPLHAVIYAAYPGLITPDVVHRLPDLVLRRVVMSTELPHSLRLQAAEQLVNDHGHTADITRLSELYDSVSYDMLTLKDPIAAAKQQADGSMARSLLWQAAKLGSLESLRALALQALWERAEQDDLVQLPGYLTPGLRQLKPDPNLAWFASTVIRTALRTGNLPMAQNWWHVLESHRNLSQDLQRTRDELAVVMALTEQRLEQDTILTWWHLQQGEAMHNAQRLLAVLEAQEVQIPASIWQQLHTQDNGLSVSALPGPGPLWLKALATYLQNGQQGAAVLTLIEPLTLVSAHKMDPQAVANMIRGLRLMGELESAQMLALEALIPLQEAAF